MLCRTIISKLEDHLNFENSVPSYYAQCVREYLDNTFLQKTGRLNRLRLLLVILFLWKIMKCAISQILN